MRLPRRFKPKITRAVVSQTGAAVCERALLGVATVLTTVLLGRWGGSAELGLFAIGFPLVCVGIALQEALITAPYTVYSLDHAGRRRRRYLGSVLAHMFALAASLSAVFALAAVACWVSGWTRVAPIITVLAPVVPFVLLREFARRVSLAHMRPFHAFLINAVATAGQIAGLLTAAHFGRLSATSAMAIVGVASIFAAIPWFLLRRRDFALDRQRLVHDWRVLVRPVYGV